LEPDVRTWVSMLSSEIDQLLTQRNPA
jgi:hypothetical protein